MLLQLGIHCVFVVAGLCTLSCYVDLFLNVGTKEQRHNAGVDIMIDVIDMRIMSSSMY